MTLTLQIVNKCFCMTNCLVIIHHHTKFGKKWLSGSGDTEQTPLDTWRKYDLDKYSLTCWTFAVTLTLNAVIPFFPQNTPAYDAVLSNQVWLRTDQQFRNNSRNSHALNIWALVVTSTLKIVNQFFCMTHCLMILHHNTKFGTNGWVVQEILSRHDQTLGENIIRTNIHWHFEPLLWPWP